MKTRLANGDLKLPRRTPAGGIKTHRLLFICLLFVSCSLCPDSTQGNVLGYVNVQLTNGYTFVANPLRTTNDTLAYLIQKAPEGTRAYVWDVTNQVFCPPALYHTTPPGWTADFDLPVGRGFVVFAPSTFTNTFVGEVLEGWLTNHVAGNNKFSLLGSKVPQTGTISSDLLFPRIDGATAHLFRRTNQRFIDACTYLDGFGWFDPKGASVTGGPVCAVAESFFVQNPGPDANWIRYFIVQAALQESVTAVSKSAASEVVTIAVTAGKVTLNIPNPGGRPYDVRFSGDGRTWSTVSTNQTGGVWTGTFANEARGYFQVINP